MSKELFNKIFAKLEKMDEYLKILREIQKINKKSFVNDFHFYGLAERYLQLSIEAMLDIGKLIIIARDFRPFQDNQDIFTVLGEEKIIPRKLFEQLGGMANFRNILVHDYEKIDREVVYQHLQKNLDQFIFFKKEIIKSLKR